MGVASVDLCLGRVRKMVLSCVAFITKFKRDSCSSLLAFFGPIIGFCSSTSFFKRLFRSFVNSNASRNGNVEMLLSFRLRVCKLGIFDGFLKRVITLSLDFGPRVQTRVRFTNSKVGCPSKALTILEQSKSETPPTTANLKYFKLLLFWRPDTRQERTSTPDPPSSSKLESVVTLENERVKYNPQKLLPAVANPSNSMAKAGFRKLTKFIPSSSRFELFWIELLRLDAICTVGFNCKLIFLKTSKEHNCDTSTWSWGSSGSKQTIKSSLKTMPCTLIIRKICIMSCTNFWVKGTITLWGGGRDSRSNLVSLTEIRLMCLNSSCRHRNRSDRSRVVFSSSKEQMSRYWNLSKKSEIIAIDFQMCSYDRER